MYEKICFQVFFTQILSTRNKTTRKQLNIPTTVWGRYIYDMWYTVAEFTTLLLSHLGLVQSGSQPKQTFQKFRLDKPVRAQRGRWQQLRERAGLWNVAGLVCSSIMIKGRDAVGINQSTKHISYCMKHVLWSFFHWLNPAALFVFCLWNNLHVLRHRCAVLQ